MNLKTKFGLAIIDKRMIDIWETLWGGPLDPSNLEVIELVTRAFLVHPYLTVSEVQNITFNKDGRPISLFDDYTPLSDTCLQHAFCEQDKELPFVTISNEESTYLESTAVHALREKLLAILPSSLTSLKTKWQVYEFINLWYLGYNVAECTEIAQDVEEFGPLVLDHEKFTPDSLKAHRLWHHDALGDAQYLVGCHRAGFTIYGVSPIYKVCLQHIFSKWPMHLFESLGRQFGEESRLIRGLGLGVTLPPVTALVLSRAKKRDDIPDVLFELRDEYKTSRDTLWEMLDKMWHTKTFLQQTKILRTLTDAADSIFPAAFPERFDVLSLGISATSGVSSILTTIREYDRPRARVTAVSFAAKLSNDLRKNLFNCRHLISRHLTKLERRQFGMD
jgi:hypothetical protein